jgi:excisionase family DNA binding protein
MFNRSPSLNSKAAYTVAEAASLLSISRASAYRLIDLGELPTVKIGRLRRVTADQLESYLKTLEDRYGFVQLR